MMSEIIGLLGDGFLVAFQPLNLGLVLLASSYLMFFVRPRSIHHEKYWRDRPIEDKPTTPWTKLARWLKD